MAFSLAIPAAPAQRIVLESAPSCFLCRSNSAPARPHVTRSGFLGQADARRTRFSAAPIALRVQPAPAWWGFSPARCEQSTAEERRRARGRMSQDEEGIGGFFIPGVNGVRLRVGVGVLSLALLAFNRAVLTSAASATPSQFRSEMIGVLASTLLIAVGVFMRRTQVERPSTSVGLEGAEVFEFAEELPERLKEELAWTSYVLCTQTAARSVLVCRLSEGGACTVLHRRGLAARDAPAPSRLSGAALPSGSNPAYLRPAEDAGAARAVAADLPFLAPNTQDTLVVPVGAGRGVLIVASDRQRAFSDKTVAWIGSLAAKLADNI
eukprot:tig00000388_g24815.t1